MRHTQFITVHLKFKIVIWKRQWKTVATYRTRQWVDLFGWNDKTCAGTTRARNKKKIDRLAGRVPFRLMIVSSLFFFFPQKFTTNLVTFSSLSCFCLCWCYFALIFCMCMCVIFIHLYSFFFFWLMMSFAIVTVVAIVVVDQLNGFIWLVGWSISFALTVSLSLSLCVCGSLLAITIQAVVHIIANHTQFTDKSISTQELERSSRQLLVVCCQRCTPFVLL